MTTSAAPFTVAITGGIAAGKSEVAHHFEQRGVPVFDADQAARDVVAPGSAGLEAIVASFGTRVLAPDDTLDRAAMRRQIFADPTARQRLEAITHPLIRERLREQLRTASGAYAMLSIPLLTEHAAHYAWIDRILVVDAPASVQRERLMRRDGIDAALAERMLASQANRESRMAIAHDVIDNSGDPGRLDAEVNRLHRLYLTLAAERDS